MNNDDRLTFLVAGAQKCGTTALDRYLRLHPGLEMAAIKETHFFDEEVAVDWRNPDYRPLHANFTEGGGRLKGEATPITLYWTPAHYRVLRYNPDIRLILLLRHPTDRAWSHWRMNIRRNLDHLPFSEAIRAGRTRVLEDGEHSGLARHSSYIERGYFGRQIRRLGANGAVPGRRAVRACRAAAGERGRYARRRGDVGRGPRLSRPDVRV
jgi:hypothetical protein